MARFGVCADIILLILSISAVKCESAIWFGNASKRRSDELVDWMLNVSSPLAYQYCGLEFADGFIAWRVRFSLDKSSWSFA